VDVRHIDPLSADKDVPALLRETPWRSYDLCVAWQMEMLGLLPMSYGIPTMIVPMFDGSSGQPEEHWRLFSEASMLNFSLNLQLRTRHLVPVQKLVRYFPDPSRFKRVTDFKELRLFFWQRRSTEVNFDTVLRLLGGQCSKMHVHFAHDDPRDLVSIPPWLSRLGVTSSTWFESADDLQRIIDGCNVLVAPRYAEGIGMLLLECMARGMCVVTSCWPVHNEYVCDGLNGLHFEPDKYNRVSLEHAELLGERARQSVEQGFAQWQRDQLTLPAFVYASASRAPSRRLPIDQAEILVLTYYRDMSLYHAMARELWNKSGGDSANAGEALSTSRMTALDRVRVMAQANPVWRLVRNRVPLPVKRAVAARLAQMIR
jgi:glycosyltransferase involved in cell wall biosynthesis